MEGRTLRVRAPVNYKAEPGGSNTPGWLKSKTTPRVFGEDKPGDAAKQADIDKENSKHDQRQSKKHNPASAVDKAEAKKDAAVARTADDSRKAPANKRTNKKGVTAASKAAADKVTEVAVSPISAAGKPDAKQESSALDVVDLLTPVDLIKKSSANRAKQKQASAQNQQPTAKESAPCDPAETEPAGKKVASRGRNANLQVIEVESKAKRGKRKAASENSDKLTAGATAVQAPASHEQDQEDFLPNRKRARPSKSLPHKAAATVGPEAAFAALQPPEAGATALREVPGLPGVMHHIPNIATATVATKDTRPAQLAAEAAASESRSRSGPARSSNSRQQASSGNAGTNKAAATGETIKPDTMPTQQSGCTKGEVAVDKPGDRAVAVAMQPTLASAGLSQGLQFHKLQADYAELQQKYTDLKEKKIQGLDGMLEEHSAKLAAHNETAVKLADHWRQEAHRQAAFAQAAGAPAMQAELKKGKEEIQRLKAALLDQEGAVLQRERQLADLKRQLKEERRKGEAPLQMDQAIQADPVQCADLEVSANLFSELSNHEAAQQSPNPMEASAVHSRGSEATPMATGNLVKKQSLHLEEAKEMCPEGHELSESYHPDGVHSTPGDSIAAAGSGFMYGGSRAKPLVPYPVGISGQGFARQPTRSRLATSHVADAPPGSPSDANAGLVHIQSSAKPLVPYPVGISVQPRSQDHRRSCFAEESHAASRAAMTPHPIRDVQNSPQVKSDARAAEQANTFEPAANSQHQISKSMSAMMLPRAVALAKATALPLPGSPAGGAPDEAPARSSGNAQAVGRLLEFVPDARMATPAGRGGTDAEGAQPMEADMSLTGSAQDDQAEMMNRSALHALMGLEATPIQAGGFKYIHRDTGLIFEIGPATPDSAGQESDADSGEPELCFNPVSLGKAVEMLPSYLQYEIKFGASQRQTLVGRIMEALGKCEILHKDMQC
ncbi:TPA: hypothetical protein ACH3X2_006056 [Trebouxia sp. C0005]